MDIHRIYDKAVGTHVPVYRIHLHVDMGIHRMEQEEMNEIERPKESEGHEWRYSTRQEKSERYGRCPAVPPIYDYQDIECRTCAGCGRYEEWRVNYCYSYDGKFGSRWTMVNTPSKPAKPHYELLKALIRFIWT